MEFKDIFYVSLHLFIYSNVFIRPVIAICSKCNLLIRNKPIVFISHDASLFQHNVILKGMTRANAKKFRSISKDSGQIMSLILHGKHKKIDSKLFLNVDLDELVNRLVVSDEQITEKFPALFRIVGDENKLQLLLKLTHISAGCTGLAESLKGPIIPLKESCFDVLKEEPISDINYNNIVNVFATFACQSMRDFGFAVLELSKLMLFRGMDMVYNAFPGSKIQCANTDGFCAIISDPNGTYIETLKGLSDQFDFSNMPSSSHFDTTNALKSGAWKIVNHGIVEMIYLKSFTSFLDICDECKSPGSSDCTFCKLFVFGIKRFPGMPKSVVKRLSHEYFRNLLRTNTRGH